MSPKYQRFRERISRYIIWDHKDEGIYRNSLEVTKVIFCLLFIGYVIIKAVGG